MSIAAPVEKRVESSAGDSLAIVAAAAVVFSAISIYLLRDFPYPRNLHAACAAILKLAPETGTAAIRVWTFWAWSAFLITLLVRKLGQDVDWLDAGLIGVAGVWVLAYFAGTLLGPVGLFRAPTLWIVSLAATVYLYPKIHLYPKMSGAVFRRPSFGFGLALIAIALAAVSLIPLQLGSPVAPYMDVLSWPASAQRVLTFGTYHPFDNDPYGAFGPNVQQPALELFYAYLALGSHTSLAVLAESSLIFPIAALTILATYRLGATLFDDVTGGTAALLLFLTTMFRWLEGMRGTAVDFVLVALGLALFLDSRRSRTLMASGALMLGVALPSHAVDGALALGVASAACGAWLLTGDLPRFRAGAICVFGAILVGAPEFAIARAAAVPVPVLMLLELAGAALIVYGASRLGPRAGDIEPRGAVHFARLLLIIVSAAILFDVVTQTGSVYGEIPATFPLLGILALAGLAVVIIRPPPTDTVGRLCTMAAILLPPLAILRVLAIAPLDTSAASEFLKFELEHKISGAWMPFAMVFPAARLVAFGCEVLPKAMVMTVVLGALIIPPPRSNEIDYYIHEHSISENWMIDFSILSNGYWIMTADSRWTAGPDGLRLFEVLRDEIRSGRVNSSTHILHLVHDVSPYTRWTRFSVFTGIDDDPVVISPTESEWPMFMIGSRVQPITHFKEAIAKRPVYILDEIPLPKDLRIPGDYERIFGSGEMTLYRRKDG